MIFEEDQSTRHRVARSILVEGPSTAAALGERLDLVTVLFSLAVIAVVFIGKRMPAGTPRLRTESRP